MGSAFGPPPAPLPPGPPFPPQPPSFFFWFVRGAGGPLGGPPGLAAGCGVGLWPAGRGRFRLAFASSAVRRGSSRPRSSRPALLLGSVFLQRPGGGCRRARPVLEAKNVSAPPVVPPRFGAFPLAGRAASCRPRPCYAGRFSAPPVGGVRGHRAVFDKYRPPLLAAAAAAASDKPRRGGRGCGPSARWGRGPCAPGSEERKYLCAPRPLGLYRHPAAGTLRNPAASCRFNRAE